MTEDNDPTRRKLLAGLAGFGTLTAASIVLSGGPDPDVGLVEANAAVDDSRVFDSVELTGECLRDFGLRPSWVLTRVHLSETAADDYNINKLAVLHDGDQITEKGVVPGQQTVSELCIPNGESTVVAVAWGGEDVDRLEITISDVPMENVND